MPDYPLSALGCTDAELKILHPKILSYLSDINNGEKLQKFLDQFSSEAKTALRQLLLTEQDDTTIGYILRNANDIKNLLMQHNIYAQIAILEHLKKYHSLSDLIKLNAVVCELGIDSNQYLLRDTPGTVNYGILDFILKHLYKNNDYSEKDKKSICNDINHFDDKEEFFRLLEYMILTKRPITTESQISFLQEMSKGDANQKLNFSTLIPLQKFYKRTAEVPSYSKHPVRELFESMFDEATLLNLDNAKLQILLMNATAIKKYVNNFLDADKPREAKELSTLSHEKLIEKINQPHSININYSNIPNSPLYLINTNFLTSFIEKFLMFEKGLSQGEILKFNITDGICNGASLAWIVSDYLKNVYSEKALEDPAAQLRDDIEYHRYCQFLLFTWQQDRSRLSQRELNEIEAYINKLLFIQNPQVLQPKIYQTKFEHTTEYVISGHIYNLTYGDHAYLALNVNDDNSFKQERFNKLEKALESLRDGYYLICFKQHACALKVENGQFTLFDPNSKSVELNIPILTAEQALNELLNIAKSMNFSTVVLVEARPASEKQPKVRINTAHYFDESGHRSLILAACRMHDAATLKELLKNISFNPFVLQPSFADDPLMMACNHGNNEILDVLLNEKNINVNINYDDLECTPLMLIIVNIHLSNDEKIKIIKKFSEHVDASEQHDLQPNIRSKNGNTALHHAVITGQLELVREVLKLPNIDINLLDESDASALTLAISMNFEDIVDELLSHPDIEINNQKPNAGSFPIATATALSNDDLKQKYISKLVNHVNKQNQHDLNINYQGLYDTALYSVLLANDVTTLEYLLKIPEINVNQLTKDGHSYIEAAIVFNYEKAFNILLKQKDIDLNIGHLEKEYTPLLRAVNDTKYLERLLKEPNIDINQSNCYFQNAIWHAAFLNSEAAVVILLKKPNLNIHQPDNNGLTPLSMALLNNNFEIIGMLLNYATTHHKPFSIQDKLSILEAITQAKDNNVALKILPYLSEALLTPDNLGNTLLGQAFAQNLNVVAISSLLINPITDLQPNITPIFLQAVSKALKECKHPDFMKESITQLIIGRIRQDLILNPQAKITWLTELKTDKFFSDPQDLKMPSAIQNNSLRLIDQAIQDLKPKDTLKRKASSEENSPSKKKRI